jgi:hypothetical protein
VGIFPGGTLYLHKMAHASVTERQDDLQLQGVALVALNKQLQVSDRWLTIIGAGCEVNKAVS